MGAQAIRIQQLWDMLATWQRPVMRVNHGPFDVSDCAILGFLLVHSMLNNVDTVVFALCVGAKEEGLLRSF